MHDPIYIILYSNVITLQHYIVPLFVSNHFIIIIKYYVGTIDRLSKPISNNRISEVINPWVFLILPLIIIQNSDHV